MSGTQAELGEYHVTPRTRTPVGEGLHAKSERLTDLIATHRSEWSLILKELESPMPGFVAFARMVEHRPSWNALNLALLSARNRVFLASLHALAAEGRFARAIDTLFDGVDAYTDTQDFGAVDSLLSEADPSKLTLKVTLAMLTITRPLRDKLENREAFFDRAYAFVQALGDDAACRLAERLR